jgi:predicted ester cyclase
MSALADSIVDQLRLIDSHDYSGAASHETPDSEYRTPFMDVRGEEPIRMARETLAVAFPDAQHDVRAVIESGSSVAIEALWAGAHSGPLATPMGDIPPTGNRAEVPMLFIVDTDEAGLIRSTHIYYDQVGMMMAMGLFPPRGPATSAAATRLPGGRPAGTARLGRPEASAATSGRR